MSQRLEERDSLGSRCISVVDDDGLEPKDRLAIALDRNGCWQQVEAICTGAERQPDQLAVIIVPELGGFECDSPAATDPALVEALIDIFHEHGYTNVMLGAGADSSALWAANRDAYALVELLGYRYCTDGGIEYDVVDLSEELVPADFPAGAVLAGTELNEHWTTADVRIVFGSNRTDDQAGYHLTMATTMRALPNLDDNYHYRLAAPPDVVIDELLSLTPVHLAVIDAIESSHGWSGGRAPRPLRTDCIIAGSDPRLVDWVGAAKMGVDPAVSPLATDTPVAELEIDGSLAVYEDWANPHPLIVDTTKNRDRSWLWSRLLPPWLQVLDTESFPLESPIDATINERTAPFFASVDDDPLAFATLVSMNTALATADDMLDRYRLFFDKDALRRSKVPLGLDPATVQPEQFGELVTEIESLTAMLDAAPARSPGLRWRRLGGATVFEYRRSIPIPLDELVAKVDIAGAIGYMNDYLGGTRVELEHDDLGRPLRQIERNLYLPQPNYVALWGGPPIDVTKVETISYGETTQTMYWKTIASTNGSAVHDDGSVTFAASSLGTSVVYFGRQQFVLPPALLSIEQALDAELRDRLVTDAYATFFSRTVSNLEALVEGREICIGRSWIDDSDPRAHEPMPGVAMEQLVDDAIDWFDSLAASADQARTVGADALGRGTPSARVDDDGFTHVAGSLERGSR